MKLLWLPGFAVVVLSGCTDNFCIGCKSSGEPVPMQQAAGIIRYRIYDQTTNLTYAEGCLISRVGDYYYQPIPLVAVPLNTQYTADIYGTLLGDDWGIDIRADSEICAEDIAFYADGFESEPWCVTGTGPTELIELSAIDMDGQAIVSSPETSLGGARYVVVSHDYGRAEMQTTTVACGDGYTYRYWEVVPASGNRE